MMIITSNNIYRHAPHTEWPEVINKGSASSSRVISTMVSLLCMIHLLVLAHTLLRMYLRCLSHLDSTSVVENSFSPMYIPRATVDGSKAMSVCWGSMGCGIKRVSLKYTGFYGQMPRRIFLTL